MEYLVTMTTRVSDGTPEEAVQDIRTREAAQSREVAAAGHLLRLWRLPLQPGEWRTLGLFAAADGDRLEERRDRGTPAGSRALTCREQAILVLRRFRDRTASTSSAATTASPVPPPTGTSMRGPRSWPPGPLACTKPWSEPGRKASPS